MVHSGCTRGNCTCGFCKADGQCEWGDCHRRATITVVNIGGVCARHGKSYTAIGYTVAGPREL